MNGFDLEKDLVPIIKGKIQIPNYEEIPLEKGVANISAGGGLATVEGINNAKPPGSKSNWGHWARYFLMRTQGGGYDGTGYVMFWDKSKGRIGHFAICVHKKIDSPGANHQRGWHPGRCEKCGLDMTVDSSD